MLQLIIVMKRLNDGEKRILLALTLLVCGVSAAAQTCSMTLPDGIPKPIAPVYIRARTSSRPRLFGPSGPQLFKPTGCTTPFNAGEQLIAACTGAGNSFVVGRGQRAYSMTTLTCDANHVNQFANTLKTAKCTGRPKAEIQATGDPCPNGGNMQRVGFAFGNNQFAELYRYCFIRSSSRTTYTQHVLNGAAIDYKQCVSRVPVRTDEIDIPGINYNKKTVNLARFNQLFGNGQPYVDGRQKYIAFGHYTPFSDFVFGYEQDATNFFVNGAPQFQAVNNVNWKALEDLSRNLASKRVYGDLEIFTGPIGQLSLPRVGSAQKVPVTFGDIAMPEAYFKVLRRPSSNAAIVFITLNNPFATVDDVKRFCQNSCQLQNMGPPASKRQMTFWPPSEERNVNDLCATSCPTSWKSSKFVDRSRGYTLCCDLTSFVSNYGILPGGILSRTLLHIPESMIR